MSAVVYVAVCIGVAAVWALVAILTDVSILPTMVVAVVWATGWTVYAVPRVR